MSSNESHRGNEKPPRFLLLTRSKSDSTIGTQRKSEQSKMTAANRQNTDVPSKIESKKNEKPPRFLRFPLRRTKSDSTIDTQRKSEQSKMTAANRQNTDVPSKIGERSSILGKAPKRVSHLMHNFQSDLADTIGVGLRRRKDEKIVGLSDGLRAYEGKTGSRTDPVAATTNSGTFGNFMDFNSVPLMENNDDLLEKEQFARKHVETRSFLLLIIGGIAAFKVFFYYLVTLDSLLGCLLSVGLTIYWYFVHGNDVEWSGGGMDWVILGFAVITPMSISINAAFARRERALINITKVRSCAFQIYTAHSLWDWGTRGKSGRASCTDIDWLEHSDAVMEQLVGITDELCRFLTLPTFSRSRHRLTHSGRKEAARTVEVAYRLLDNLYTQRITRLMIYDERLKAAGLPATEISRVRQYERFIGEAIEDLRMVKMYRTPQSLRSFARLFTTLLPAFYAPAFAQVGIDLNSLGLGIAFAIITSLGLTALFESIQVLEDPFVAFITLDGIDVREEFQVLHWQQLVNTRDIIFPLADPYPELQARLKDRLRPEEIVRLCSNISVGSNFNDESDVNDVNDKVTSASDITTTALNNRQRIFSTDSVNTTSTMGRTHHRLESRDGPSSRTSGFVLLDLNSSIRGL
eukprot:CAMPEP_0198283520 /NCGR_PEP_ID=MMETSP1449-20131203/3086_1 /TAXON_ID=420275 /ORGANISM="Attheya septentrionalis, Strain CCMP2084" /LENGTH=633 /DNA_ID=CAMNT_0043980153 /DNA_START=181 /DNA_END=2082 /DNA_ORIENTATION=+